MRFRKKPVKVEAIQYNGDNGNEISDWIGVENFDNTLNYPNIITREGVMRVDVGDWVIREPFPTNDRKFYPCKPDIFEQTYEAPDAAHARAVEQGDLKREAMEIIETIGSIESGSIETYRKARIWLSKFFPNRIV